jgi:hypothetical protein
VVYIQITRDWTPIDDIKFCGWFRRSDPFLGPKRDRVLPRIELDELRKEVLEGEIEYFLGDMLAKLGDKDDEGNFYLRKDVTVGELVSKGKRVIMYESFFGVYPQTNHELEQGDDKPMKFIFLNSYWHTYDKYAEKNFDKCVEWAEK